MNIYKIFKNLSILAAGLVIANTGFGFLCKTDIKRIRAIQFVSTVSDPNKVSITLQLESDFDDVTEIDLFSTTQFTTSDGKKVGINNVVDSTTLIACMENDSLWEDEKRPVILLKEEPKSATYVILDDNGDFCLFGDAKDAKIEGLESFFSKKSYSYGRTEKSIKERVIQFQIKRKYDFDSIDSEDSLVYFIINDDVNEFIGLSSDAGFEPNKDLFSKFSYIHLMALSGAVKCFKHAILTNLYDLKGIALYAVLGGNYEIIHILEQKFREGSIAIDQGDTFSQRKDLFDFRIIYARNFEIGDYLLSHYDEFSSTGVFNVNELDGIEYICSKLIRQGMWSRIPCCLNNLPEGNVEEIKARGSANRILEVACRYGSCFLVKYLIEKWECDPKTKDSSNETLLHTASLHGHLDIVKYLVEKCHCNPEIKNDYNETPLFRASTCGHLNTVEYLFEKCHCDPNVQNKYKETPLSKAFKYGRLDTAKCLIEKCHCDPEGQMENGWTPLCIAVNNSHSKVVEYLVEKCKATITDEIIQAAGNEEIKNYLLEQQKEQKRNQNQ